MGANLSKDTITAVDTTADVISGPDRFTQVVLGAMWLGSAYAIGMIWCAVALLTRWAGPHGERGFNLFSIIAAFIISAGWPIVLVYLAMQ